MAIDGGSGLLSPCRASRWLNVAIGSATETAPPLSSAEANQARSQTIRPAGTTLSAPMLAWATNAPAPTRARAPIRAGPTTVACASIRAPAWMTTGPSTRAVASIACPAPTSTSEPLAPSPRSSTAARTECSTAASQPDSWVRSSAPS